jgi:dipeptidyl-peptidase-4
MGLSIIPFAAHRSFAQVDEAKQLTIESIFAEGGITGRGPETVKWSPDNTRISFLQRDNAGDQAQLWSVDTLTGEKKVLISDSKLATLAPSTTGIRDEREKERLTRYHVAAYSWSPDSKNILFDANGQLWLYSLATGTGVQFSASTEPGQNPQFSPDGRHIAYLNKRNLYVRTIDGREERQLTRDKNENVLNGEADWVYAEELDVRSNYFWSPDSKRIAFMQMDETKVPTYPITDWIPTHPDVELEKYPKVGDANPIVRLGVVNVDGGRIQWLSVPVEEGGYIPRFGWVRDGLIWAEALNRAQDKLELYFLSADSGKGGKMLTEYSPDAWVNVTDDFKILKSGNQFLWSSWRDGHTHIYLYSFNRETPWLGGAKQERQLERGEYEVMAVVGLDEDSGLLYVTANRDDPRQTQVYAVKLDGSSMDPVSHEAGTHQATFSSDGKYYVDDFSAKLSPPQMRLCSVAGRCLPVWSSASVSNYHLIAPVDMEFKAADGTTLLGELWLPAKTPPGAKIPLIVYLYGGPASQLVRDTWIGARGLFHQMLVRDGFAIFTVDNRGTPNRGRTFSTATRHQFGVVELKDQLDCLDQVLGKYSQLDRSRIGIWGWSNGGSLTLYAMTHSDIFKAGIAVAPVTDQRNYDSIYTERYLGLLRENEKAYEQAAIPNSADHLRGELLLVHGTSDDNVHLQNSIQLIDALTKAGRQFRLMLYPNKTHSINGAATRTHLYHMMEDHWRDVLGP